MKKIFTLFVAALTAVGAMATDYTGPLVVTINGTASPAQQTTIGLDKVTDTSYNFNLKDFSFAGIQVGDVNLNAVEGNVVDGVTYLHTAQTVAVNIYGMALDLPIILRAEERGKQLYADMDIDFSQMNMAIHVTFNGGGSLGGFQSPNSDFENYYTYTNHNNIAEPLHWHSFASAGGALAGAVNGTKHTESSDVVRPNSTGKKSLKMVSTSILGIIANGTVTTGRMNAGGLTAADPKNHAELDMSNTDRDGNGDPYYVVLNGQPDSVHVWLAFKQNKANSAHPYATVSAITTDGTYYQDPQDKDYANKRAEAKNAKIEATYTNDTPTWKEYSIPFATVDGSIAPKSILVTISTNADPGQGSNGDELYIDDLSLVYNAPTVTGITVKGSAVPNFVASTASYTVAVTGEVKPEDIVVTTTGALDAHVSKTLKQNGNNVVATIIVTSGDYQKFHTYTLTLEGATTTGIKAVDVDDNRAGEAAPAAIYNLNGQRVSEMQPGHVYIVRQGGKTVKVTK